LRRERDRLVADRRGFVRASGGGQDVPEDLGRDGGERRAGVAAKAEAVGVLGVADRADGHAVEFRRVTRG
jgi:hypothetical protein